MKGRTVVSSWYTVLYDSFNNSKIATCFFLDSPSLSAVATEEPGCNMLTLWTVSCTQAVAQVVG